MFKRARISENDRFGRLTVVAPVGKTAHGDRKWSCVCDCGTSTEVTSVYLLHSTACSCGCLYRERKAAATRGAYTRCQEFGIWSSMIQRCTNPNRSSYPDYGGRGITVCEEWRRSFRSFLSHVGKRPSPAHTLDRIDNNGNYQPGNVRWATRLEQVLNSRGPRWITFHGETLCLSEWAGRVGVTPTSLCSRFKKGLTVEEALSRPNRYHKAIARSLVASRCEEEFELEMADEAEERV